VFRTLFFSRKDDPHAYISVILPKVPQHRPLHQLEIFDHVCTVQTVHVEALEVEVVCHHRVMRSCTRKTEIEARSKYNSPVPSETILPDVHEVCA
jgi:hypothetical protein